MSGVDYQGLAFIIAAFGGLVSPALAIALFVRQGRAAAKLDTVHDLVDGLAHRKDVAIEDAAFRAGKEVGISIERVDPMVPLTDAVGAAVAAVVTTNGKPAV